jgi:hypothetical protein
VCHFFQLHTLDRRRKPSLCFYIRQAREYGPSEIPSSLCVSHHHIDRPHSPPKPRLSERALPFAIITPSTRTASLPPSSLKRKLFWLLPIPRSLLPWSVRLLPNRRPLPPIPFPSHVSTCPFCQFAQLYANTSSLRPLPIRSSPTPHEVRPLSSRPYVPFHISLLIRARAYHPSPYLLDSHPGTFSLRPPMARQLSIVSLMLPPPLPPGAASTPARATHIASNLYLSSHLNER